MGTVSAPQRLTLRQSVALVWRTLRSMRTALILLLLIALASVAGSLLPQWPNSPERVLQYRADHEIWGTFFERAGLFDVFGSWWFVLLTALLFVSLVACLVPRTRALWRTLRTPPMQAREIDAFPLYAEASVAAGPDQAIESARRVLRRRGYRVARDPARPALAAEKGSAREVGSLGFHWALILLLAGVIYGKGTGFSGLIAVVEGQTWVDAEANYDGTIRAGRFFSGEFTGIGLRLRDFGSDFLRTGQPMDFVSRVDLLDPDGSPIRREEIRVNHPAKVEGLWIYQSSFGWAPVIEVAAGGEVVASGPIVMDRDPPPEGVPEFAMPWRGVVKLPGGGSGGLDRAVELELWPDSRALTALLGGGEPQAMLVEFDPIIRFTVWEGALGDLSTNRLDTTGLEEGASGIVGAGRTADLSDGGALAAGDRGSGATISFPELRQYSVFQVGRDAGVPLVLAAAILILVGLLPALYSSRRKVWVRADPDGDGAVLRVGGLAMQRKPQFEEEFDRLIRALASAAGGTPTPEPRPAEGMPGEPEPGEPEPGEPEPGEPEKVQTP
jgi:cytochrome c biogenesis protein